MAQVPLVGPFQGPFETLVPDASIRFQLKRAMDLLCAGILLLALVPTLVFIALLVRWSSPGPIIFRQSRIGRDGRPFTFYKFRTMVHGNDPSLHRNYYADLVHGVAQPTDGRFKLVQDPRVTSVGRILRRYSLDELPQLFNVLKGDMSLVGPRPPIPYEVELYGAREFQRLSVRPGLTGLWQVSGRSTLTFEQMIELDLAYISKWSLLLDLRIIVRTPLAVLLGEGAC